MSKIFVSKRISKVNFYVESRIAPEKYFHTFN